jgi:hypothetical protein
MMVEPEGMSATAASADGKTLFSGDLSRRRIAGAGALAPGVTEIHCNTGETGWTRFVGEGGIGDQLRS